MKDLLFDTGLDRPENVIPRVVDWTCRTISDEILAMEEENKVKKVRVQVEIRIVEEIHW